MVLKNPHYPNIPTAVRNANFNSCAGGCVPFRICCRYQARFTMLRGAGAASFSFVDLFDQCLFNWSTSNRSTALKQCQSGNYTYVETDTNKTHPTKLSYQDDLDVTNFWRSHGPLCWTNKKRKTIAILNLSHRKSSVRLWVCVCFQGGCPVRTF